MSQEQSRLAAWGCRLSQSVAALSAHPYAQLSLIFLCLAWYEAGWTSNGLTVALSILAITLTQMVLNSQGQREAEARRRDLALHAKLDELILATREARDEIAGIEELEEEDIEALKQAGTVTSLVPRRAAARS
jgi:low affinity Fe/Cu permease